MSAAKTRQKLAKKRSLQVVNEHFEPIFNAVFGSAIVFQHPVKGNVDRIACCDPQMMLTNCLTMTEKNERGNRYSNNEQYAAGL